MKPVAWMFQGYFSTDERVGYHRRGVPLYTADQLREVEQQRDELVAALELLHGHAQLFLGHYTPHHNVFDSTTAAIAKVKPTPDDLSDIGLVGLP